MKETISCLFVFMGDEYEVTGTVFADYDGDSELGTSDIYEVNIISLYDTDGYEWDASGELGEAAEEALVNEYRFNS